MEDDVNVSIMQELVTIWKDIFESRDIGPTSDFFDLGGDSVTAMMLMLKVEDRFNIVCDSGLVFEASTLAVFANRIGELCEVEITTGENTDDPSHG